MPLRLEIGPKDIEKSQVLHRPARHAREACVPMDGLAASVAELLDDIQRTLLERAVQFRDEHTQRVDSYDDFKQ